MAFHKRKPQGRFYSVFYLNWVFKRKNPPFLVMSIIPILEDFLFLWLWYNLINIGSFSAYMIEIIGFCLIFEQFKGISPFMNSSTYTENNNE